MPRSRSRFARIVRRLLATLAVCGGVLAMLGLAGFQVLRGVVAPVVAGALAGLSAWATAVLVLSWVVFALAVVSLLAMPPIAWPFSPPFGLIQGLLRLWLAAFIP